MHENAPINTAAPSRLVRLAPNVLSASRLALAVAFPFINPKWWLAVVLVAGLSDVADGIIARRFGVSTIKGALLDATADKLFVLSVLVTLVATGTVAWWQALAVIVRDLAVLLVAAYVAVQRQWGAFSRMSPGIAGKATTGLVFAWFVVVTARLDMLELPVFTLAVVCSATAAGVYLARFGWELRRRGR